MPADPGIAIIDYGMGNLRSVAKALGSLGLECEVTGDPERLGRARRAILPGVGAFGDAMEELHSRGLVPALRELAASGRPLLGICLGMQLLMESSEESPATAGLGLVPGRVRRFDPEALGPLKSPHMGWNRVRRAAGGDWPLLMSIPDGEYFYFVHSFYVEPAPGAAGQVAVTTHGVEFVSALSRANLYATQFHPEKSQRAGLRLLANFASLDPTRVSMGCP